MTFYSLFKEISNEVTKTVKDCIGRMQQARCEHQKAVAEKKRIAAVQAQQQAVLQQTQRNQFITNTYATLLNTAFAECLNALPQYLRISPQKIDPLSLRSQFNGSDWTITVNVPNGKSFTPAARKHLKEQLQQIFNNLYHHTVHSLCDYISGDCYEWCNIMADAQNGHESTKTEAHFAKNYFNFFNELSHCLYYITVNDIGATPSTLQIHYSVDGGAFQHYHPSNYFHLRNSILNG